MNILEDQILVRRDTLANFSARGVIPANGEPIGVIDAITGKVTSLRVGDGVRTVDLLPALSKGDKGDPGLPGGVAIEVLAGDTEWAWVCLYQDTREVAFGQYTDGSYYPQQDTSQVQAVELSPDQGWVFAAYFADTNEIQYGVRADGTVYPAPAAPATAVRTVLVGDSLTQNWASYLSSVVAALGHPIDDIGIGGQGATSIAARYGGAPARVAVDVVIPATGSVAVTLNVGPFSDTTTSFPVAISGVRGTFVSATSADNYRSGTFTRTTDGTATKVWAGTPVLSRLDYRRSWPVLGMGRNGFQADGAIPQIVAAIQGCLDWATPDARAHALVWSIPPFTGEEAGTPARATLDAANAAIRDAFPTRWVDFSGYLRSVEALQSVGVTPTSQDQADIANGMTPTTFRTQLNGAVDAGHFGPAGYAALNLRLIAEYASRDWIA